MTNLTAIIIGRDQSLTLASAIASTRPLPVIYLDAGSTDGSRELAASLDATVLADPPASGGGAMMRNYAADHAETDYCICLAPDDVLITQAQPDEIHAGDAALVEVRESRFQGHHFRVPRIWHRRKRWIGRAHEFIDAANVVESSAVIIHTRGPWHDKPSDPEGVAKHLQADIAENPTEPRWWYYLSRERHDQQRWAVAIPLLEHYIRISRFPAECADAYLMLSRCYWNMHRGDDARRAVSQAVMLFPEFAEAWRAWADYVHPPAAAKFREIAATATNAGVLFVR